MDMTHCLVSLTQEQQEEESAGGEADFAFRRAAASRGASSWLPLAQSLHLDTDNHVSGGVKVGGGDRVRGKSVVRSYPWVVVF